MKVLPFVHEGLGNSSYLVETLAGRAVLVDPDRSAHRYLRAAAEIGLEIAGVLETHVHADFVSGAREVAAATGAPLFMPARSGSNLAHVAVAGGQRLTVAGTEIEAFASPGHTPEHLSYALRRGAGPPALFSGGSLIVGGAARTDLISPAMTETLTRAQFQTLRRSFATLPDETLLFPTHGGGSFCSTGSGERRTSTLGEERRHNPVLSFEDEDEFVSWFPSTFPAVPAYFARMRALNQAGPRLRREIAMPGPLAPEEFGAALAGGALAVDLRARDEYARGHVPGSLSIVFRDSFAVWLGWLAPAEATLLFVPGAEPVERAVDEALLVGHERFAGWLEGGFAAWQAAGRPVEAAGFVTAEEARRLLADGALALDVREPDEYASGHIEGALHVPLGRLAQELGRADRGRPVVVYCGLGERASSAVSLLQKAGLRDVANLDGGIDAWRDAGYATV